MKLRDQRRVAAEAGVDAKTVRRYLDGERIRPSSRERIEEALRALGFDAAVRGAA